MNSKICTNCGNKNPVNGTDNRLVTESCGHVKCMQCLLQETAGCKACKAQENHEAKEIIKGNLEPSEDEATNHRDVHLLEMKAQTTETNEIQKTIDKEVIIVPKLETSHIKFDQENQLYKCLVCKKRFKSRSQVSYHAYCNGQRKPFPCIEPDCNKSFRTHSHLEYHKRAHRKEKSFICDTCGEGFFHPSKLQRHKLTHTDEKNHVCARCKKAFNNKSSLNKHMLIHTKERPYPCPRCERRFRDRSNLNKHIARHEAKMLSCGTCGREVLGRRALSEHSLRHEASRLHCPHCDHAFLTRKDLRRHMLAHSEWKPFVCTVCGRRFHRKDNLLRHVKTHPLQNDTTSLDPTSLDPVPLDPAPPDPGPPDPASVTPTTASPVILKIKHHKQDEICQKAKLEVLNPLPPLPQEVIQKHLSTPKEEVIDKKSIMEANTARESVIVGLLERKVPSPVTEYVHKIRKANLISQKVVPLPPIDEYKFLELATKDRNLDIGPLPKNIQPYKNILRDKSEKQCEEDKATPEVHWRKKRLTDTE